MVIQPLIWVVTPLPNIEYAVWPWIPYRYRYRYIYIERERRIFQATMEVVDWVGVISI